MQDGIAVGNQGVGNDLFVRRIGFRLGAGQEEIVAAREKGAQIFFRLEIQAMKTAELLEETPADNQNVFVGLAH
jgi:hypothetical protein